MRHQLAAKLGRQIHSRTWKKLVAERYVAEVLDPKEPRTVDDLVRIVRGWERVAEDNALVAGDDLLPRPSPRKPRDPKRLEDRYRWARSTVSVRAAEADPRVRTFRAEVLEDELLDVDEIPRWIKRIARREGAPTKLVEVELADEETLVGTTLFGGPHRVLGWQFRTLVYPDGGALRWVPVKLGGVLDQLRAISQALADLHRWQETQATAFVLSGAPPLIPTLRGAVSYDRQRVILTVEPTVSPRSVEQAYRGLRRKLLGRRWRHAEPHTYDLAAHVVTNSDLRWPELLRSWNAQQPKERRFGDLRQFRSTARRALRHLTWEFRQLDSNEPSSIARPSRGRRRS